MRYVSTRGAAPALDFSEVLLAGLARDGGLYLPDSWPARDRAAWAALKDQPYAPAATAIMAPFVGATLAPSTFGDLVADSYRNFDDPAVTPLVQIGDDDYLLELFHGPTLAFKDLAMQVLARLVDIELARRNARLTLVVATSGDTGSSAIEAFKRSARVNLFVLHPKGRVSDMQRRQMTTLRAPSIHNIALEGTFDDCQAIVKALFNDLSFRDAVALAGVNSINWARVMAQIPYYAVAALKLGAPARAAAFSVPTGNFGDVYAGYVARRMGLPVARLIIATNVNDILVQAVEKGIYRRGNVQATQSPSMDIQVASNFERLLFEACGRDGATVVDLMDNLARTGGFVLPPEAHRYVQAEFEAARVSEDETTATIAAVYRDSGRVIDPHTAVGVAAGRRKRVPGVPLICLATAHPAKFPDAVRKAIGLDVPLPAALRDLAGLPEEAHVLPNDVSAVRRFIETRLGARA